MKVYEALKEELIKNEKSLGKCHNVIYGYTEDQSQLSRSEAFKKTFRFGRIKQFMI